MTPFEFPDDVKKNLDRCGPGEWVPIPQQDGTIYFVCALTSVLDDDYVRREVNKGLDATDKHGAEPIDIDVFLKEAQQRHRSQAA